MFTRAHQIIEFALILLIVLCLAPGQAGAAMKQGELTTVRQPNGERIPVRVYGDEHYSRIESLDGYTVIGDEESGAFFYAGLTADGESLVSTGIRLQPQAPAGLNVQPGIRISAAASQALVSQSRQNMESSANKGLFVLPSNTGNVLGLTILVDFSDEPATFPAADLEAMMNGINYRAYGNNMSVREYFGNVSDGMLDYSNFVTPVYVRAPNPRSYYDQYFLSESARWERGRELVSDVLLFLWTQGHDFSNYDANGDGYIDAINILYAGDQGTNGLWPHSWTLDWATGIFPLGGLDTHRYQVSNITSTAWDASTGTIVTTLSPGTILHENGHMLFFWPDLYDRNGAADGGNNPNGIGRYCIMASNRGKQPQKPCAYLRNRAGWCDVVELNSPMENVYMPATINRIARYSNPSNAAEYFLIENRDDSWIDSALGAEGLAIWHIDENGNNDHEMMSPLLHYEVTLVQADGNWDLEHGNGADDTDLWSSPDYVTLSASTNPNTNWWNGSSSGLCITDISETGPSMSFSFGTIASPKMLSPADYALLPTVGVLSWKEVKGNSYDLRILNSAGSVVRSFTNMTTDSYVYNLTPDYYSWELTAHGDCGTSATSVQHFWTTCLPDPPVLASPADGAEVGGMRGTLDWEVLVLATHYSVVVEDMMGSEVLRVDNLTSTEYNYQLPYGSYEWFVEAYGDCQYHAVSERRSLTLTSVCLPTTVTALDYGIVTRSETVQKTFLITNNTQITVSGTVRTSDVPDFQVVWGLGDYTLEPGQNQLVGVNFTPSSAGPKAMAVRYCDDESVYVLCHGEGSGPWTRLDQTEFDFGTMSVGSDSTMSFSFANLGDSGLLFGTVAEYCDHFELLAGAGTYTLAAGQSLEVVVRYAPTSDGTHECTISLGPESLNFSVTGRAVRPSYRIHVNAMAPPFGDGFNWGTAMNDLSQALAATDSLMMVDPTGMLECEVWVAEGTYVAPFSLRNRVALVGGFSGTETQMSERDWIAHPSVLTAEVGGPEIEDNMGTIVLADHVDDTAVLDGFVITRAYREPALLSRTATPVLRNLVVRDNLNHRGDGGAIAVLGSVSPALMSNLLLENNHADNGGAIYVDRANLTLIGSVLRGNSADSNLGSGAIHIRGGDSATYELDAVTLAENESSNAAAIYVEKGQLNARNAIIWGNLASQPGREINLGSSASIVWDHCIIEHSGGSGTAWNLDFGTDAGDNQDTDPRFVNSVPGDVRLLSDSPAIDAASNPHASIGTRDVFGNQRVRGNAMDIGGVEFAPIVTDAPGPIESAMLLQLRDAYPNPFNPSTTLAFELDAPARVSLTIYDARGRQVRRLIAGEEMQAGMHDRVWDGMDDAGFKVASGVYLYRLVAGDQQQSKKMTLAK